MVESCVCRGCHSLVDRINEIIARYDRSTSNSGTRCPCCGSDVPESLVGTRAGRPHSAIKSTTYPTFRFVSRKASYEPVSSTKDLSTARPGPYLQRYLTTREVCPSARGQYTSQQKSFGPSNDVSIPSHENPSIAGKREISLDSLASTACNICQKPDKNRRVSFSVPYYPSSSRISAFSLRFPSTQPSNFRFEVTQPLPYQNPLSVETPSTGIFTSMNHFHSTPLNSDERHPHRRSPFYNSSLLRPTTYSHEAFSRRISSSSRPMWSSDNIFENTRLTTLTDSPRNSSAVETESKRKSIGVDKYTCTTQKTDAAVQRLASEIIFIDMNEDLAKAEAEDISHAAGFLGNPKIVGSKDFSLARDAAVCIISLGDKTKENREPSALLDQNFNAFKIVIPNVCKYAPNSVLLIVTNPVDILSYVAMKLSGYPPNRVIGLGTFVDSCRFQSLIAEKLGISASAVQALIIGESGRTSVPVWSAVAVTGMKLKDINKEIGTKSDPESWNELHTKVIDYDNDLISRKGHTNWGIGICASEVVDAIVRNTCVCITVSTFVKGCRHGLEKDVFMSLPCVVGRNGVQSYVRHLYTPEEQELTTMSCRTIYENQRTILEKLE